MLPTGIRIQCFLHTTELHGSETGRGRRRMKAQYKMKFLRRGKGCTKLYRIRNGEIRAERKIK